MPAFVSKETAGFIVYKDRLFLAWLTYCVFNQLLGLSWQSVFQRWRDVSLLGDVKIRALTLGLHFHRSSHFHSGTEVCTSLWQNCHLPHGPRAQNFVGSSVVQLSTVPNTQGMLQKYWLNYSAEAHSEATYLFHPLSYLHVLPVSKPCVVFPEVIVRIYFLLFIYAFIHSVMPGFNCGTLDLRFSLWHANSKILVAACGIQSPEQELNKGPLHWECSLSHWTTREVPTVRILNQQCSLGTNQAASELES